MLTCKYCKKKWQRKYNLEKHQKTAKYCIEIQKNLVKKNKSKRNKGKSKISNKTEQFRTIDSNDDKDDSKIICGHCGKIFTGKFAVYNSMKHDKKCIYEKMQQKIAEQSSKILTLQQKIDEMTMAAINRPTNQTVINQKIQNGSNGSNNNGTRSKGNITSRALAGVIMDDTTKMVDKFQTLIEAVYQHTLVDGSQQAWEDTVKDQKNPDVKNFSSGLSQIQKQKAGKNTSTHR